MNQKRLKVKLADKIDAADRKQKANRKGSKRRNDENRSHLPSSRFHPIGELTSQYGAAENELERVGSPRLS